MNVTYDVGVAFAVVLALNAVLVAGIAAAKLRRERRQAAAERLRDALVPELLALVDGQRSTASLPPPGTFAGSIALECIVSLIAGVKGSAQRSLVELLEERGYVGVLRDRLRSGDSVRRAQAAMFLGASRSRHAVDALVYAMLSDRSAEVRMIAAEALGSIGDPRAVTPLMQALIDPERYQPLRIADVIAGLGVAAVPDLERMLAGENAEGIARALDILNVIGTLENPGLATALLAHPSPEVRARAAALLGKAGIVDSVPLLADAACDPVWFVRLRVVKALKALDVPNLTPARAAYFGALERLLNDGNWYVRRNASAALAVAGEEGFEILQSTPSDVARAAIQAHHVRRSEAVQTIF